MEGTQEVAGSQDQVITEEGSTPVESQSFFEDESVSENELRGIEEEALAGDDENQDESGQEENTATDPPADKTGEQEGETETKDTDTTADEKPGSESEDTATSEKTPKGFVPYQALSEERGKRQTLKQKVADLEAELEDVKARAPEEGQEEFKVLSDTELDELIDDDPQEALRYQNRLTRHKDERRKVEARDTDDQNQINVAAERIQEIVPGIYDEGGKVGAELADFAIENGFDPDFLTVLTDPRTKIIPHEGKGASRLAAGAASVISMIHALKSGGAGAQANREAIRAEVFTEVTTEVMAKLKAGGGTIPTSINDLPGAPESLETKVLSEADLANMTEADRAKYLGG